MSSLEKELIEVIAYLEKAIKQMDEHRAKFKEIQAEQLEQQLPVSWPPIKAKIGKPEKL